VKPLTIPVVETRPAEDLAELAHRINAAHEAGEGATRAGLAHFRDAGAALLRAKARCGHGRWLAWLQKNVRFSYREASRYMRVARDWDKLDTVSNLADALRLLTDDASDEGGETAAARRDSGIPEAEGLGRDGRTINTENIDGQAPPKEPPLDLEGDPEPSARRLELGVVAPSHRLGRPGEFVPLEEWDSWDDGRRQRLWGALGDAPSGSTAMTFQGGDSIEWARWSWNPVTGCRHNCPYCYARDLANRLYDPKLKFEPALWPARLHAPRNVKVPADKIAAVVGDGPHARAERTGLKSVFVCSMADLFGRWVPAEWIEAVLAEVRAAPQWNFLFLTKFPIRMAEFNFPDNAWVGTTVDCQARVANAEKAFRKVRAGVKWLSVEPLIERLKFTDLGAFQWLVIGGASKSSRTAEWHPPLQWVVDLRKQAEAAGLAVYFKTNLLWQCRGYAGAPDVEPQEAPAALRYLPSTS
jgi:protein gp37